MVLDALVEGVVVLEDVVHVAVQGALQDGLGVAQGLVDDGDAGGGQRGQGDGGGAGDAEAALGLVVVLGAAVAAGAGGGLGLRGLLAGRRCRRPCRAWRS